MINNQLKEQLRQLNLAFLGNGDKSPELTDCLKVIAEITESVVLVCDKEGSIQAVYSGELSASDRLGRLILEGSLAHDAGFMDLISSGKESVNQPETALKSARKGRKSEKTEKAWFYSFIPVAGVDKILAYMLFASPDKPFDEAKELIVEVAAILTGILLWQEFKDQEDENVRNRQLAEGAFDSLSFSEVEAIQEILKNISNNESVVVASKIADSLGITRSVIVNALRKFESAGIIESRSLGMKGTFIRVKNKHALEIVAARSDRISHI